MINNNENAFIYCTSIPSKGVNIIIKIKNNKIKNTFLI